MDSGSIPIGFVRFSVGWKWVGIDGKGYANTTYISEFHPHIPAYPGPRTKGSPPPPTYGPCFESCGRLVVQDVLLQASHQLGLDPGLECRRELRLLLPLCGALVASHGRPYRRLLRVPHQQVVRRTERKVRSRSSKESQELQICYPSKSHRLQ